MPPPSSVPSRFNADSSSVHSTSDVGPEAVHSSGQPSAHPSQPSSSDVSYVPTVRPSHPRMPPMIGASQQTSHAAPVTPQTVGVSHRSAPIATAGPPPAHAAPSLAPADANVFSGYHGLPAHMSGINSPFPNIPFPIDPSQIDPQLMGHSASFGLPPLGHSGIPVEQSFMDHRSMSAVDDSFAKPSRPRRSSRKRSNPNAGTAGRDKEDDTHNHPEAMSASGRKRRSKKTTDENAPGSTTKRKTSDSRRGRTRAPSPPPYDPDGDPGEELDPTVVTMATLCDDTGRGRVSTRAAQVVSNHAAWRAANREKRARMKAIIEAKKYGRNLEEEDEAAGQTANATEQVEQFTSADAATAAPNASNLDDDTADKPADDFDYTENLAVSRYNVQVRIGANGEIILDEDSLFVNRDEEHRTEDYTHVEESDFTKFVNSATYSKKVRGSRWSSEETELFYDALSQFGENYELISYVLPGRDRKACKNKFKTEDKKNPARITYCLNNRKPYDIATLSRMTGKDFSGPPPEIRAPTPIRPAEQQPAPEEETPAHKSKTKRKKSRTPSARDADVEIIGSIDSMDKEDS
ncbi:hypothetical protein C8Q74DRAFT_1364763 [Fomes fomentarius]|nr:hypothetical protein C8Q74DRAFT_1364763 [Fomes fomentarius]